MLRIRELVLFAFSVQMTVRAGTGMSKTTHPHVAAKNGETVTLPCSHRWNLSKKEDRETLGHVTWFLTDPDNPDTTVASHDCPIGRGKSSCKTTTFNSQTSLDLDFENKTANLIIADVRSTDSGLYFCLVQTTDGLIQQAVRLSVSGTYPSIRITSSGGAHPDDPSKIILTADTEETLTCSAFLSKNFTGTIFWNSHGLNLTEGLQQQISISDGEDFMTSSVTFHPTYADNNKWVECGITESNTSPRRVSLKVQDLAAYSDYVASDVPILNTDDPLTTAAEDTAVVSSSTHNIEILNLKTRPSLTVSDGPVYESHLLNIFLLGLCVLFFSIILILSCGCCLRKIRKLMAAKNVNADINMDVTNIGSMQALSLSSAYQDLNAPPRLLDKRNTGVLHHDYEYIATDGDGNGDLNLSQYVKKENNMNTWTCTIYETPDNEQDLYLDGYPSDQGRIIG